MFVFKIEIHLKYTLVVLYDDKYNKLSIVILLPFFRNSLANVLGKFLTLLVSIFMDKTPPCAIEEKIEILTKH